jgi:acetyl-CoA synthetase
MTTVGEPIEPEVWKWYHKVVGKGEAIIVDTWWQTETGGFLCSTLPAIDPMKPGSTGPALPGIHPVIYDDDGNELVPGVGKAGNICIRNVKQYYEKYCKDSKSKDWRDWPYLTGDAATQSADRYYRILGRIDDVINVSGHRLGTKELESAALVVPEVAESAVVPVADAIKGRVPEIYISLKPGHEADEDIAAKVSSTIISEIGSIAKPRKVWIVADMPKTRSGKIMRRVLAAISNKQDVGDTMTLANPETVESIQKMIDAST